MTPEDVLNLIPKLDKCGQNISDLKKYIIERKMKCKNFGEGFEDGYEHFRVCALFRRAREEVGVIQEQLASQPENPCCFRCQTR
jgi:hypothetical protein